MRSKFLKSIHAKIVALALGTATVPMLVFLITSTNRSMDTLTESIAKDLEAKSVLAAREVDNFIAHSIINARILSQSRVLKQEDMPAMTLFLKDVNEASPSISNLGVTDTRGHVIAHSAHPGGGDLLIPEKTVTIKGLVSVVAKAKQGDVYVSGVQESSQGAAIYLITPITDENEGRVLKVSTCAGSFNIMRQV